MSIEIGYVVVEFNQASHQPDLPFGTILHFTEEDAREDAQDQAAKTKAVGRRETFRVARVELLDEEDDDV